MDLTWIANRLPDAERELSDRAKSMFGVIDDTVQSVRNIASRLRPEVLDQLGLSAAIGWHTRDFRKRSGLRCKLSLPAYTPELDRGTIDGGIPHFSGIADECRAPRACNRIDVAVLVDSRTLVLTVEDNGKGIDEAAVYSSKSLGLMGMRERVVPFGGSIEIAKVRDRGTRVRVSIPLGLK